MSSLSRVLHWPFNAYPPHLTCGASRKPAHEHKPWVRARFPGSSSEPPYQHLSRCITPLSSQPSSESMKAGAPISSPQRSASTESFVDRDIRREPLSLLPHTQQVSTYGANNTPCCDPPASMAGYMIRSAEERCGSSPDQWGPFELQSSHLFLEIWHYRSQDSVGEDTTVFDVWLGAIGAGCLA